MLNLLRVMLLLFFLGVAVSCNAHQISTDEWPSNLALELKVNRIKCQKQILQLSVLLINKSDEAVTLRVPTYAHQLAVYSLTSQGRTSLIMDLARQVKGRSYPSKNIEIAADGKVVLKECVDLSSYKEELTKQPFIEFRARFHYFPYVDNSTDIGLLKSNIVKLSLD